jgi:hypothetical protein
LFDISGTSPESEASTAEPEAAPVVEDETPSASGSLFDVEPDEAERGGSPAPDADEAPQSAESVEDEEPEKKDERRKDGDPNEGGSLFDL